MDHYKGKISVEEAIHLPNRMFHGLYARKVKSFETKEGIERAANGVLEEKLEEEVGL